MRVIDGVLPAVAHLRGAEILVDALGHVNETKLLKVLDVGGGKRAS